MKKNIVKSIIAESKKNPPCKFFLLFLEKPKSSHLSFSFSYFIHGESAVCASVDVREHAPVRRLGHAHINAAGSLATTVQVLLSIYFNFALHITKYKYSIKKNVWYIIVIYI